MSETQNSTEQAVVCGMPDFSKLALEDRERLFGFKEKSQAMPLDQIAIRNDGAYFITLQFLHENGNWYGKSGVSIFHAETDSYWPGNKVNAYVQWDSVVNVEGFHLEQGQSLVFTGALGSAHIHVEDADGNVVKEII
jgi:hypothetical protein